MRKRSCVLLMAVTLGLTGCSTSVPDLSKIDNDIAGQYVADALLQKDKNYDDSLEYDHSKLEATPTPEPTVVPTVEPTVSPDSSQTQSSQSAGDSQQGASTKGEGQTEENTKSVSMGELFGVSGISVKATSYGVKKSYGTDYAVCTPAKGKKLLVVYFTVSNTGNTTQKVKLANKKIQYGLQVDGKTLGQPLKTIVDADLQYFNEKIAPGKQKQGVLLFEVDKGAKISQVSVEAVYKNAKASANVH